MPKYKISYVKIDYLNFYIDAQNEEKALEIANTKDEGSHEAEIIEGEWEESPNEDEYIQEVEE